MISPKPSVLASLFLGLTLIANGAQALPEDRAQPIKIEADRADMDEKKGVSTYSGTVILQQGSLSIEAEKITIRSNTAGIEEVMAYGAPAHFSQQPATDKPMTHAYGESIEYQLNSEQITLTGQAKLIQNGDAFSGKRIVYDIRHATVEAMGGKSPADGRVQLIIQPRKPTQ